MHYGKYIRWQDLPDSPGKQVLEEILNTPVPDFTQLDKDVKAFEKKEYERSIEYMKRKKKIDGGH